MMTAFNFTGNFRLANNLISRFIWDYPHTVNLHILDSRCCRITPEYEQIFLPVSAILPTRISHITDQKVYMTVDNKDFFTDYGPFTENEILGTEEIWITRSNLDPYTHLLAKHFWTCLDPQLLPPSPYLYSMWQSAMANHCLVWLVSWFSPSWQLSTTQLLVHHALCPVGWEGEWEN